MFFIRSCQKNYISEDDLKIGKLQDDLQFFYAVLGSPWVALHMLVSKFNSFPAISPLFRGGGSGWLEELKIRLTQLGLANLFELSLAKKM